MTEEDMKKEEKKTTEMITDERGFFNNINPDTNPEKGGKPSPLITENPAVQQEKVLELTVSVSVSGSEITILKASIKNPSTSSLSLSPSPTSPTSPISITSIAHLTSPTPITNSALSNIIKGEAYRAAALELRNIVASGIWNHSNIAHTASHKIFDVEARYRELDKISYEYTILAEQFEKEADKLEKENERQKENKDRLKFIEES